MVEVLAIDDLAAAIRAQDRRALARAITLIESTRADHRTQAIALLEALANDAGGAKRIAVSGTPGVGKSTFIEIFGRHIIAAGHRLAVLAIDPSSSVSGGSILGDKTRMQDLARDPKAFIRPSPSGGTLGGVAARTREVMLLCEAGGFDVLIVETVGVGQSETMAAQMTDMFILLLAPAGGDELQGIKRGIIELADLILINKADGILADVAWKAAGEYRLATQLVRGRSPHWHVPVDVCSALEDKNIAESWARVKDYWQALEPHGEIATRRAHQACRWMWNEISDALDQRFREHPAICRQIETIEADVSSGKLPPTTAAQRLLQFFIEHNERRDK